MNTAFLQIFPGSVSVATVSPVGFAFSTHRPIDVSVLCVFEVSVLDFFGLASDVAF